MSASVIFTRFSVFLLASFISVVKSVQFANLQTCWNAQHWDYEPLPSDQVNTTERLMAFNAKHPVPEQTIIEFREWTCMEDKV